MKNTTKTQDAVLSSLKASIKNAVDQHGGPIDLKCGNFSCGDVIAIQECHRASKADFKIVSKAGNHGYISHKAANFSHNGYGSVGWRAFDGRSRYKNRQIWAYAKWALEYCKKHQGGTCMDGVFTWKEGGLRGVWSFPPKAVQNAIVYGPEYGGNRSEFNCDLAAVGQGTLTPDAAKKTFELTFDTLTSNGDVPMDDDEPILCIASSVGSQTKIYRTSITEGFRGWVGVFPKRILKSHSSKGKGLQELSWPSDSELNQ